MKLFAKLTALTLGIGVVLVVVSFLPRPAGGTAPTPVTVTNASVPIRQATANSVTISCPGPYYVTSSCIYTAGTPPASKSLGDTVFPLPSGDRLVVTDISWTLSCGSDSASPGDTVAVSITTSVGTLYQGVAVLDAAGVIGGRADHFTSGLVLTSLASPSFIETTYDVATCSPAISAMLQGYMAD
jgi:hypothetical protein